MVTHPYLLKNSSLPMIPSRFPYPLIPSTVVHIPGSGVLPEYYAAVGGEENAVTCVTAARAGEGKGDDGDETDVYDGSTAQDGENSAAEVGGEIGEDEEDDGADHVGGSGLSLGWLLRRSSRGPGISHQLSSKT